MTVILVWVKNCDIWLFCLPGNREIPADLDQRQSHLPVAKFRFDVGQTAKHILSSSTASEADCKHLSLLVEGFEAHLRVASLTGIADLITSTEPAEILPMRIDAVDIRFILQVGKFRLRYSLT